MRRWPGSAALRAAVAAALFATLFASGCGTPSAPPPARLHRLPADAPEVPVATAAAAAAAAAEAASAAPALPSATARSGSGTPAVWEIARNVHIPRYAERDAMVTARGDAGIELLAGERWAEPLRDAVPRLLRQDLARLRGPALVWPAPAPLAAARLSVELLELLAEPAPQRLRLRARWVLQPPAGAARSGEVALQVPLARADGDSIARAHRAALWQLAVRIAHDASS